MRLVEQWGREIEQANRPPEETDPRRKAIIDSTATALVLRDPRPWIHPDVVAPFWTGPGPVPSRWQMEGLAKKAKEQVPRLDGLDGIMAP
jgi:hypothetical protein